MNTAKRVLCILSAVLLLVGMTACGKDEENKKPPVIGGEITTTTNATTTTVPTEPPVVLDTNMITGLADMSGDGLTRPVGIMVANNDFIQDEQVGIGQADMWVEAETEGGITRLMAVFASTSRVPEAIGPVRSARTPFVKTAEALGLAYSHAGGSYTALGYLSSSDVADLDVNGGDNGSAYSWRDYDYPHDYEYRLRTSGEDLTQYMEDMGNQTTAKRDFPWTFGEQSGETATNVDITLSGAQKIGFDFDAETGLYYKHNGYAETPHTDIAGNAIAPKTVLVLYTDKYWENDTTIDFYLQGGTGYVFSDGVMRQFQWSRSSGGFTMNEMDGSQLTIGEGKVYMCIADTGYEYDLSYGA